MERYKYYKIDDSQTSVLPLCTNINTYLYSWIDGISKEGRKERIRIAARKEKNRDWTLSKQDCRGTRFVFSKLCIIIQERRRFEMASEHGEEIIRNVASRVQEEERLFKDVRCNAFSFIIQLLFPSPAPSRNYSLHRYFHQSSRLGTTRKESIIARIITRRDFIQPILESHLLEKFQKFGGILKSVEGSASKSVDTNSFFSRKGVPLNRHARSSRLASRGHPKTGQGRYGEEGVARGGEGNGTAAVPFPESPSGACAPLAWRSSVRFAGGVHR